MVKLLQENYPFVKVCGYDPAVEEFENLLTEKFDFVIVTDVLEHIPENELPDTLKEISALSDKVFFHLNNEKYSPDQYFELFSKFFSFVDFFPGLYPVNSSCITFKVPSSLVEDWQFLIRPNEMKFIESLDGAVELIRDFYEVIIYSADTKGKAFLDYLHYAGIIKKVSCIAVNEVPYGRMLTFVNEMPVIPLEHLRHFRKTALFIVIGAEENFNAAYTKLKLYGCKKVIFATNDVLVQAQSYISNMMSNGQILLWYMRRFDEKLDTLALRVDEQNEVQVTNTAAFAEYRNAFRGKKVVIVASGPTAKYYEPIPDAIHIGMNQAWKREDINFDYLFTYDVAVDNKTLEFPASKGFDKIREKIFIGRKVERQHNVVLNYPEDVLFKAEDKIVFYCIGAMDSDQRIYRDICTHPSFMYGSVAFQALHFALFTAPAEIYLVGCDTSRAGHFYNDANLKAPLLNVRDLKMGYVRLKMFALQYYPETKIISINPVGLRDLFLDEYTENYQTALREEKAGW